MALHKWCCFSLAALLGFGGSAGTSSAGPVRVWEIDFGDPQEKSRWGPYPFDRNGTPVEWEIVARTPTDPAGAKVLRVSSSGGLGVETSVRIWRPFPPELRLDPSETAILEWEWKIADVEVSDWVGIGIAWTPFTGTKRDLHLLAYSHSRYTKAWLVLFDPPNRWATHRFGGWDLLSWHTVSGIPLKRPAGVVLEFHEPVKQVVEIARLRLEAWPRGSVPYPSELGARRIPPHEKQFREAPFETLRAAKSGALEDLDGDGLPELLVLQWRNHAHLYRNRRGRFDEEISASAGLGLSLLGNGALFADLDSDCDPDLLISAEFDVPRLFENRRGLWFVERANLPDRFLGHWYGAAAADLDLDGDVDLAFVGPYPLVHGIPILRNEGAFHFEAVQWIDPAQLPDRGELNFGIVLGDLDGDADPDALLSREIFLRNEAETFIHVREPWMAQDTTKAEGILVADLTGDGNPDLFVVRDTVESGTPGARLLQGNGWGRFQELTLKGGFPELHAAEVALAEDFDNDGDLDLYICQRHWANHLLLNDGDAVFRDATEAAGFEDAGGCDAAAAADVDGDGGMDVAIFRYGWSPRILMNRLPRGGWIGIVTRAEGAMTDAVGARVVAKDPETGEPITTRWVQRGRGFGANGPGEIRIGVGDRAVVDLEVRFPSGSVRRIGGVETGQTILLREGAGLVARLDEARFPAVRGFRRMVAERPAIPWALFGAAAVAGCVTVMARRARVALLVVVLLTAVASLVLGVAPGRGIGGFPALLWAVGGMFGAVVPAVSRAGGHYLRWMAGGAAPSPSAEELIRFTHDFRHAGIETRAILSIHARAQNLFPEGSLAPRFLAELREMRVRFPETTGASLDRLLRLARATFPDLEGTEGLAREVDALRASLSALGSVAEDHTSLRAWRDRILPHLAAVRDGIPALLREIDSRCATPVQEAVNEVLIHVAGRIRDSGVDVSLSCRDARADARALVAHQDLLLVLENLLSNALVALEGRPGGRISLRLRSEGTRLVLECEDNGPGVPEQLRERIFEYGFTTRPEGRGYGLARSREILGHYGGSLEIAAREEGQGATFIVTMRSGKAGDARIQ